MLSVPDRQTALHHRTYVAYFVDGDLITIADTSDLNLATQRNRLLKITIFGEILILLLLLDTGVNCHGCKA